jgi:hypothetical protein
MTEPEGPFDWGETVRVRPAAPDAARPGELAAVVGFRREASPTGERTLCAIELSDGRDAEVDVALLERVTLTNAEGLQRDVR